MKITPDNDRHVWEVIVTAIEALDPPTNDEKVITLSGLISRLVYLAYEHGVDLPVYDATNCDVQSVWLDEVNYETPRIIIG